MLRKAKFWQHFGIRDPELPPKFGKSPSIFLELGDFPPLNFDPSANTAMHTVTQTKIMSAL